ELPERLTLLPRPGPAYVWLNDAWTLDAELDLDIKTKEELRWIAQALLLAAQEIYKHEDQDPTATASEDGWRQYRVALRAWPQHASFPDMDKRPTPPAQTEDADDET
ncbi:MAG TPA: hypothetical protein VNV36_23150, partial [Pseudomonas sp.]|nr:hypothetical protein [Pseudomonas sp.]